MKLVEEQGHGGSIAYIINRRGDCQMLDDVVSWADDSNKAKQRAAERFNQIKAEWCQMGGRGLSRALRRHISGVHTPFDEWKLGGYRVFFYQDGSRLVMLAALKKTKWKEQSAIENAADLAKQYLTARDQGQLEIELKKV